MSRVASIVVVFLVIVGVAGWQLAVLLGDRAVEVGSTLYPYRTLLAPLLDADRPGAATVWLGDSTIMTMHESIPYPVALDRRAGLQSDVVAAPGLDFYAYYALMGPTLAKSPQLVVLVANLRLFDPAGFRSFNDLVAFVPAAELPRLLALPYAARGMTAPGLLLARLAGTEGGFTALLMAQGLRRQAADAEWWSALGPEHPTGPGWSVAERGARGLDAKVRHYARSIGPHHPLVRFAGAAVDMATRHGVRTLVVVSPMPLDVLRARGLYDARRTAAAIAALQDTVLANGGALIDLHAALPRDAFADVEGHMTAAGAERVASLLFDPVTAALGRPRPFGREFDTVQR